MADYPVGFLDSGETGTHSRKMLKNPSLSAARKRGLPAVIPIRTVVIGRPGILESKTCSRVTRALMETGNGSFRSGGTENTQGTGVGEAQSAFQLRTPRVDGFLTAR